MPNPSRTTLTVKIVVTEQNANMVNLDNIKRVL